MNDETAVITYIVLHYMTLDETIDCVDSVRKLLDGNDKILIIDNGSPNGSGVELKKRYEADRFIEVFLNKENLGFAKANNIGIRKARADYHSDFVICLNNDTFIRQSDFREVLLSEYEKHRFAVAGPGIRNADGSICEASPSIPVHTTVSRARIGRTIAGMKWLLSFVKLDLPIARMTERKDQNDLWKHYQEDIQLLGCCIIFSPLYFEKLDGFDPDTFLYLEELLLYLQVRHAGLKIAYLPELEIVHLGQAATKETLKNDGARRRRFLYKNQVRSFGTVIKRLQNHER